MDKCHFAVMTEQHIYLVDQYTIDVIYYIGPLSSLKQMRSLTFPFNLFCTNSYPAVIVLDTDAFKLVDIAQSGITGSSKPVATIT